MEATREAGRGNDLKGAMRTGRSALDEALYTIARTPIATAGLIYMGARVAFTAAPALQAIQEGCVVCILTGVPLLLYETYASSKPAGSQSVGYVAAREASSNA
jgi:hypothetical protein